MTMTTSQPDPVAENSGLLRTYMSDHPDALIAYAKWYGQVTEAITSAEMTTIDSKSMTLVCTLKNGSKREVRISLKPALNGYDEAKPRLLEMKAIAQEQLGIVEAPQITSFKFPHEAKHAAILVSVVYYFALAPTNSSSLLFAPARIVDSLIGPKPFLYTAYVFIIGHILESLYTLWLCWTYRTGLLLGVTYVVATIMFGMPIWSDLKKRVQAARIGTATKAMKE